MIAAFLVIYGLLGSPPALAIESEHKFATVEECQTWQVAASKNLVARLAENGMTFDRIETKCLPDIGQTPADVFALPQPELQAPTPVPSPQAQ